MEKYLDSKWVHESITPSIVGRCETFGEYLAKKDNNKEALTTSQIRRFFGEVKRIEMQAEVNLSDVAMLKPLIAYAVGRKTDKYGRCKSKIEDFYNEMSECISEIENKDDFKRFVKIFEAIVAYHKKYGGQEYGGK